MVNVNVILVYSEDLSRILMCRRRKPPYQGLLNLVGGHIEPGEDGYDAAYRELYEETGITRGDISLHCVIRTEYPMSECMLEMYAGRLQREVAVYGDENDLIWVDAGENFYDSDRYGGDGNIGHLVREIQQYYAQQVLGVPENATGR